MLDNFNSAWKQIKLSNAMHPIASKDILAIIEHTESTHRTKLQRVLLDLAMFVSVTMFFQGG